MSNKKKYMPPLIECIIIEHESSLAAGSAKINPTRNPSPAVVEEWTEYDEENRTIDW